MAPIRLALAQINPTVGDLVGNAALILRSCRAAAARGAQVVAFPEMVITGYPIEDLALRESFQLAVGRQVTELAISLAGSGLGDLTVIVGTLDTLAGRPRNGAAVLHGGSIVASYAKHHLPSYGVFDEHRLFAPGDQSCVIDVAGTSISVAICEDMWQPDSPAQVAATSSADVLLVLNASPFERGKADARLELCRLRARETDCVLAYVNCVGGQDELVFDGGSMVVAPNGRVLASGRRFVEDLLIIDVGGSTGDFDNYEVPPPESTEQPGDRAGPEVPDTEDVYSALVLGLGDYVRKNSQRSVVLGLSGGIDSALVAAIACDALGPAHVFGVAMPSVYSSGHSVEDALELATRTGLSIRTIPIASVVDAYQSLLHLGGLAEENLQARIRGTTLMAISNAEGHLVLATGNKSELAVGYTTIYGDAVGGFGPIKDVPKTLVWSLSRWRNEVAQARGETPPIPPRSIDKPPSAELRPDQLDSDSLPDYVELDAILAAYVEGRLGSAEIFACGFDTEVVERVIQLTDGAEYKRRQYPPGTKITQLAFGRDRRVPITSKWREPPRTN